MAVPRVLTFNFHEPYLCLMAKLGIPLDVGLYAEPPHAREWHTEFRPVPENLTFVEEATWRADLEAEQYDVVIAHNETNAIDLLPCKVPALLLCHNRRTFLESTMQTDPEKNRALYAKALDKLVHLFDFIFISESKRSDYGIDGRVIRPGIDVNDYGGYTGEVREILRVGNGMRGRNLMFDVDFQETVCRDLPNKLLGKDPYIPYATPSKSFEDLLDHYRTRRCMLHVTCGQYEDGYNLAMLEAMATGMPVVALSNPTSPITDGVDGYTAPDAGALRERLQLLLDEPDLAAAVGERGRDTVARAFPIADFVANWREAIEEAAARSTRYTARQTEAPREPAPGTKAARKRILLDYVSSPLTTGRYIEWALRKRHAVMTSGARIPEALLKEWGFDAPYPAYPLQQIPTASDGSAPYLANFIPDSFKPELFVWIDSGMELIPVDLDAIDCPKVGYFIDTHMECETRLRMARRFDYVFLAQQAQLETFVRAGIKNVAWLPLAVSPELHDVDAVPRTIDVSYVGSLSEHTDPRRRALLNRVRKAFPNNRIGMYWPEDMAQIYAQSKIVVNASANVDVNMRVFEALASGALLITDRADGLEELFRDGQHLVVYEKDDDLFDLVQYFLDHDDERERIAQAGRKLVYERHTYDHRVDQMIRMVVEDIERGGAPKGETRFERGGYYMCPRPEVAAQIPKFAKRVLDCGCGGGEFGRSLKRQGVEEVVGIEVVERAYEIAKDNLDRAYHGSIEDMDLPFDDRYFDCVVFADVLEHLVEPAAALRKVTRCLTEDGLIVISIPNIRFWQQVQMHAEGRWHYEDCGIMDRTHLRFFCKADLADLIESAGLELVKLAPLSEWPAEHLPRDENGCIHLGKATIGPLDDDEYQEFLVYQYLVIAGRPGVDRLNPARRALADGQFEQAYTLAKEAGNCDALERVRLMAKALAKVGKLETAEALYRSALRHEPNHVPTKADLGMILLAQERTADARPFLEAAHASDPRNARYVGGLGLLAQADGDAATGFDRVLESLQIDVDNEDLVHHAIALGRDLGRSHELDELLAEFCAFRPGNVRMNLELAARWLETGRVPDAIEKLELALMVEPDNENAQALLRDARSKAHETRA